MRNIITIILLLFSYIVGAQTHPCYLTTSSAKKETKKLIEKEDWAINNFEELKIRTDVYANREPDWLESRLQMYWNTHATDVYIKSEFFDHVGGKKAPVPTVAFTGSRGHATNYVRPRLEDLQPRQEDPRGMYLANNTIEGKPFEWVPIGRTGRIIESINSEILGIARDAAFLWWITGEEKYGRLANKVIDTYMSGIYYRNIPKDMTDGHQQTLVGMSSFEVIHEDALNALVPMYDFLYDYIKKNAPKKIEIYEAAFKKWADNIINNGVPHNNWNLIQARYIMNIAIILGDDKSYSDGKGKQYYTEYVLEKSSLRQWSLSKLADYGFDSKTGIWAESPGYSINVVRDYAEFADLLGYNMDYNLVNRLPIIAKAVAATPQYLFPNRMVVGFGDTHPSELNPILFEKMVKNAQLFKNRNQEVEFTKMLKLFSKSTTTKGINRPVAVTSFFLDKPLVIDNEIKAGDINDYVTPLFYSPNVSWLVQRNGMNKNNSLMISQNGSYGNHMHANGINMELYGKGYPLAPDAGIGFTLYQGQDYLEYYSQFPAHNTVCVDGISSYPIMKSSHAFRLTGSFPSSGEKIDYTPITYSEVDFLEPETQAEQKRVMGIINTSDTTGYYVDIFRSRRRDGNDKMHDYFYHNLGQRMTLACSDGSSLNLQNTQELSFAGAHLYAYSYIYNQKSSVTDSDVKSSYTIDMPDNDNITMTMWMKGEKDRTLFSALSPVNEGLSRIKEMPYVIKEQPTLTYVARQSGEAWTRPFVAIFEPSTVSSKGTINNISYPKVNTSAKSVEAIEVEHTTGRRDLIVSADDNKAMSNIGSTKVRAKYVVIAGNDMVFMGEGTWLDTESITIESALPSNVLLQQREGKWYYKSDVPVTITILGKIIKKGISKELCLL